MNNWICGVKNIKNRIGDIFFAKIWSSSWTGEIPVSYTHLDVYKRQAFSILLTFALTCFAWIFFRAENMTSALTYIRNIFSESLFTIPKSLPFKEFFLIGVMLILEWFNRTQEHGLEVERYHVWLRRFIYAAVIYLIIRYANFGSNEFIYFQF